MLSLENYTQARMDNLISGIKQIHEAMVRHRDPKPRNMMIVTGSPDRVVWIDFDRAHTYDKETISDEQRSLIEEEQEIVVDFGDAMVSNSIVYPGSLF